MTHFWDSPSLSILTHLWDSPSLSISDWLLRFSLTVYVDSSLRFSLTVYFDSPLRFSLTVYFDSPLRFSLTVYFWFLCTRDIHFFCLYIIRFVNHCCFFGRLWKNKNNLNPLPLLKKQWDLCNQCLSPLSCEFEPRSWRGVLDTTLCDKVWQWLAAGFSLVSSTNKTHHHNITENGVE